MKIEHVAIWTKNLERLNDFYKIYFKGVSGEKYINPAKNFESYFLTFESGSRLELMKMPTVPETKNDQMKQFTGIIHLAFSAGSKEKVDQLTEQLKQAGFSVLDGPRTTGDGYYESTVLDPDGNRIEITV